MTLIRRIYRWRKAPLWLCLFLVFVFPLNASSQALVNSATLAAVGTAFTYQGQLLQNGSPANGQFDFQFTLFDAESGGNALGSNPINGLTVTNGAFTVQLNFGAVFTGTPRWLEIAVRVAGSGDFVTLTPRQFLAPTPYAIYADSAGVANSANTATTANSVAWTGITGIPAGFADGVDNEGVGGASGDITSVTAANGLTGGGAGGDVTLGVNFAVVAPLNHTHAGQEWTTTSSPGLSIINTAPTGVSLGLYGRSDSPAGSGVRGSAPATTGLNAGVSGFSYSVDGYGLYGINKAASSGGAENNEAIAVIGISEPVGGIGVEGYSQATSGASHGIVGYTNSPNGYAIFGQNNFSTNGFATAIRGQSGAIGGTGIAGVASAEAGESWGVYGYSKSPNGYGIIGYNAANTASGPQYAAGVYGYSDADGGIGVLGRATQSSGYAGYFFGDVGVNGHLSKSSGSFKIDHPLDPENKYLYHSFVESPDMMNIYNGNALLDAKGEALVQLPDWFEALNMEFRYQLTAIGAPGPNLYVAQEIVNNQFKVAGGAANSKVSWQVTGVRNDPYAQAHRIQVEVDKPVAEQGTYLHAAEYKQPTTSALTAQSGVEKKLADPTLDAKPAQPMAEPAQPEINN